MESSEPASSQPAENTAPSSSDAAAQQQQDQQAQQQQEQQQQQEAQNQQQQAQQQQQQQAQNQQPVYDTIQSGEGARQVAERNGMTLEQILALNPGIDTSVFYPGQPLRIK